MVRCFLSLLINSKNGFQVGKRNLSMKAMWQLGWTRKKHAHCVVKICGYGLPGKGRVPANNSGVAAVSLIADIRNRYQIDICGDDGMDRNQLKTSFAFF